MGGNIIVAVRFDFIPSNDDDGDNGDTPHHRSSNYPSNW